jgi:ubiquinone/menaquinone biosynthesis C-methylase UbiE
MDARAMPTLRGAAERGATLLARRLGYTLQPWRVDEKSEGFVGYVTQARQAGMDVNEWEEQALGWVPCLPALERVVFPSLQPDWRVVEIGPGTGRFSRHIAARVPRGELRLVDHSPWLVAFLRSYFRDMPNVSVTQNDGFVLPFQESGWADLVFSAGTLIALKLGAIELYAREFHRVLKNGGQVIFDYIDPDTPEGWRHLTSQTPFLRSVYTYHAASAVEKVFSSVGFRIGERIQDGKSTYLTVHKD